MTLDGKRYNSTFILFIANSVSIKDFTRPDFTISQHNPKHFLEQKLKLP